MKFKRILTTVVANGPRVAVRLEDKGKAQVSITMAASDGTMFNYRGSGTNPPDSMFPPGLYQCAVVVSAFNHGAFGQQYDSEIEIAGQVVATTKGAVAVGKTESGGITFSLQVL